MSAEQERLLAQKLTTLVDRSGPQVRQEGQRLVIEQNGQTFVIELNTTTQQQGSTPRFR